MSTSGRTGSSANTAPPLTTPVSPHVAHLATVGGSRSRGGTFIKAACETHAGTLRATSERASPPPAGMAPPAPAAATVVGVVVLVGMEATPTPPPTTTQYFRFISGLILVIRSGSEVFGIILNLYQVSLERYIVDLDDFRSP